MRIKASSGLLCLVVFLAGNRVASASPPPVRQTVSAPSPAATLPMQNKKDIRWNLERNYAKGVMTKTADGKQSYQAVRAIDVSQLAPELRQVDTSIPSTPDTKSPFAAWSKEFKGEDLSATNGFASVVDERVFTDLRKVNGETAEKLGQDGVVIGRVKLKEYDPVELVRFLVSSGIVDANIHIHATVTGTYFASDDGHWFSLHSDDPYWTNTDNIARYDFGIHISSDGTIRMVPKQHVGKPQKATE